MFLGHLDVVVGSHYSEMSVDFGVIFVHSLLESLDVSDQTQPNNAVRPAFLESLGLNVDVLERFEGDTSDRVVRGDRERPFGWVDGEIVGVPD